MGKRLTAMCDDCGRSYGDPGFQDLIIPNWAWREISKHGDETGLLCPSCICAALERAGIENVPGAFMSGPIKTVQPELMRVMRACENMEDRTHE